MLRTLRCLPLLVMPLLVACASLPTGPGVLVLPGAGKSFDQFRSDDLLCRQFAFEGIGGVTPNRASVASGVGSAALGTALGAAAGAAIGGGQGAAVGAGSGLLAGGLVGAGAASGSGYIVQERYDMGYVQCMYAKGHRVPVSGHITDGSPQEGNVPARSIPPPPPPGTPPPPSSR